MKNGTCILMIISCFCLITRSGVYAEELRFPSTKEEIIEALGQAPEVKNGALPLSEEGVSLFSKGKTRGLASIKEEEEALNRAPKVGALILFDTNSANIKEESLPLLHEYGEALKDALPDAVLVVAGHTDSKGNDEYNMKLSKKRAEAIKQFFVQKFEIDSKRLLVKAYGESKPLEDNSTQEGREKNRRVEFIRIR